MRTLVHLSDLHFGRIDPTLIEPLSRRWSNARARCRRRLGRPDAARPRARSSRRRAPSSTACRGRRSSCRATTTCRSTASGSASSARSASTGASSTHDLEPVFVDDEIAVLGVNTARSLTFKDGRINEEQMASIQRRFDAARPTR